MIRSRYNTTTKGDNMIYVTVTGEDNSFDEYWFDPADENTLTDFLLQNAARS
jgi:hypothetical protein